MTVERDDIDDEANGSNEEVPDISTWAPLGEQSEYQDEAMIANKFILGFWLKLKHQFCHKSPVQIE